MTLSNFSISAYLASRPRVVLWLVLAVWVGTTLAGMWYLNPIGPTSFGVCRSPTRPGR